MFRLDDHGAPTHVAGVPPVYFSESGGTLAQSGDREAPLAKFFASVVLALRAGLGPILWQVPPQLAFDATRLRDFFALLPRATRAAARLARRHDNRLKVAPDLKTDADRPLRYALEVRHESFRDPRFPDVLREHGMAL